MHPVLFKIGSFTVYSYGVMLLTAFIIGYYFFLQEVKRKKLDERIAIDITIIAVFCGVIGSKLLFVIENLDEFFINPARVAFSSGGFTFTNANRCNLLFILLMMNDFNLIISFSVLIHPTNILFTIIQYNN